MSNKIPNKMRKGAIYIRVSTDKQEELSPDAQKRLLIDYAKKNDIIVQIENIFLENGISGRKADKRPQFQQMIAKAKSKEHPFDVILVWKFSRFARNQEESIVYKSLLKKNNVEVISISEPLIDGPFGSLIERIIEWMDEYYSIRLSGEVIRGMTEKALRGGYQAAAPLGYTSVKDSSPVVNKEQAKIVQYIFEQYVKYGIDKTTIARNLNALGYKTTRGNNFEKRTIDYILENPFYIGKIRWNKTAHGSRTRKDEEEIIIADGKHEAIIAIDTFNKAVQRSRNDYIPKKRKGVGYTKHWLCGLLKCNICGSNLVYYKDIRTKCGTGNFQCYQYSHGLHKESSSISELKAVDAVLTIIQQVLDKQQIEFEYITPATSNNKNKLEKYNAELNKIDIKEQRIKAAYKDGIDTLQEYKENKLRLQTERAELEVKISQFDNKETDPDADLKPIILNNCKSVYDILVSDIDTETKASAIRGICSKIVYDKEHFDFKMFFYLAKH